MKINNFLSHVSNTFSFIFNINFYAIGHGSWCKLLSFGNGKNDKVFDKIDVVTLAILLTLRCFFKRLNFESRGILLTKYNSLSGPFDKI